MRTIKIGPLVYTIKEDYPIFDEKGELLYGKISYEAGEITVSSRASWALKNVILWHEILHGIISQTALEIANEEQVVEALSHGIVQVLQDNEEI